LAVGARWARRVAAPEVHGPGCGSIRPGESWVVAFWLRAMAVAVQVGEAVTRVWVAAGGRLGGRSPREASRLFRLLPGSGKGSAAVVRLTFVISWSGGEMAGSGGAVAGPGGRWLTWMTVSGLAGGSALVIADLPGWLLRGGLGGG